MQVRILVIKGARADCKEAVHLIEGISAEALPADRGYDTSEIIAHAAAAGMQVDIPPKKSRKKKRAYDEYLYRMRHLVENAFLILKRLRGVATRHAKTRDGFIASLQVRCIAIWTGVLA